MLSTSFSPKNILEASSRPSCHASCHVMLSLMTSSLTRLASSTSSESLFFISSMTAVAAFLRCWLLVLDATVTGYMSACGCIFPTLQSRSCMIAFTLGYCVWILAMSWGMTASQVSTDTSFRPFAISSLSLSLSPFLNQIVSSLRVSCKISAIGLDLPSSRDLKKPLTASTTCRSFSSSLFPPPAALSLPASSAVFWTHW
mmetsp:Transcript_24894/g.51699  ORF Transcript_24894/g.51699 Transcript_24894/m.51699 type:complete len:200 (+) Transcript_24894:731-1330(+)